MELLVFLVNFQKKFRKMFAIWLLPDEKDTKYLEKIIDNSSLEFDSPKFIPHITVFGLVDTEFTIVEKTVMKSIDKIKPFTVHKITIDQSENVWKSVFVDIKKIENLF